MRAIILGTLACLVALMHVREAGPAPVPMKRRGKADVVVMETSLGSIKIKLFSKQAPASVANFLRYVDERFYDNLVFHRVIANFMIQGGGLDGDLVEKKAGKPIKNEAGNGLSNKRGTIACARSAAADSATSQFYINLKDNDFLDRNKARDQIGYCVFGEVIEGMDVVDKIAKAATGTRGVHQDVPAQNVVIKSVRRAEQHSKARD